MSARTVLDIVRVLAATTSMIMILSPIPIVYQIHKTHKTGYMSMFPLISVLANCHVWMMYGYMDKNIFPVFSTFGVGELFALVYVVVFYRWTTQRTKANKLILVFGIAVVAVTSYVVLGGYGYTGQTRHEVALCTGYLAVGAGVVVYASPLEKIFNVFRYKSAVFIPIHMVVAASTNNAVWVAYSSLIGRWFVFVPNLVMLIVGIFQVVVYFFIYNPKTHPLAPDWKLQRNTPTEADDDDLEAGSTPSPSDELESPTFVSIHSPVGSSLPSPQTKV